MKETKRNNSKTKSKGSTRSQSTKAGRSRSSAVRDGRKSSSSSRGGNSRRGEGGREASMRGQGRRRQNAPRDGEKNSIVLGVIDANERGFAFLIRDDQERDAYISPDSLLGAIHGDRVKASTWRRNDGSFEAEVIEILNATTKLVMGTFVKDFGGSYVIADEKRITCNIFVDEASSKDAKTGDKVLVSIKSRKGGLSGTISQVFDSNDKTDFDVLSVVIAHNLATEFPKQVLRETAAIPESISDEEIGARHDFRHELSITIDGDDSRDFDDAVYLTKKGSGYELTVHIADVSHYVRAGSHLDKEALKRGTSVYFPGSFLPMLPEKICNNVCSLVENQDRLTLSVIMQISSAGKVTKHKITDGVIKSAHRLTYTKVEKILEGDKDLAREYADVVPMLSDMRELARILTQKRKARGSVDFDLPESQIILRDDGSVEDVKKAPRLTSHRIIEEFMLVTNETVAEHMSKAVAPFVYRGHLPPTELKMQNFEEFLMSMSIMWERSEPVVPMDYARFLPTLPQNLAAIVNMMALRSMTKAAYFPENKGHFGLAAEFYCHFTAPIRRYPDLIIHRIIKDYLKNGKKCFSKYNEFVAEAASISSVTERNADEAEREVDDIFKARFMQSKIGMSFDGVISGVNEWGVFVQLENTVEGMVRKENLPGGGYMFNPIISSLSNMTSIYKAGDPMRVKVDSINKHKIEFTLAD